MPSVQIESTYTCGESCAFVTFCELNIEECNKCLDIVITATLQVEWCRELEILLLHCVHVHLLTENKHYVYVATLTLIDIKVINHKAKHLTRLEFKKIFNKLYFIDIIVL